MNPYSAPRRAVVGGIGARHHGFGGDAAGIYAGSANQLAFNNGDSFAGSGQAGGKRRAGLSGSNHDGIVSNGHGKQCRIGNPENWMLKSVCVYCASSDKAPAIYQQAATDLGAALARAGLTVVYGGGGAGLMGRLASGALAEGGKVIGVIPQFMDELEWGHGGLSERHVVDDMHVRKRRMLELSDAVVALPGGCGTFEELFEALTWKRLGLVGESHRAGERQRLLRSLPDIDATRHRGALHGPATSRHVVRGQRSIVGGQGTPRRAGMVRTGARFRRDEG